MEERNIISALRTLPPLTNIDDSNAADIADNAANSPLPDDKLTIDEANALAAAYPYFSLPSKILLSSNDSQLPADVKSAHLHAVARTATSASVLYSLLDNATEEPFYPDTTPVTPSTESAIDAFLSNYGSTSPEEEEALNKLIFNPTPDYAQLLAQEEQKDIPTVGSSTPGTHDDLLNRFIIKQKQEEGSVATPTANTLPPETVAARHSDTPGEAPTDDSLMSESLARIFIRQQQYDRALKIITQLNLNYPEKSVYFADQMRFLRKLINNRNFKSRNIK